MKNKREDEKLKRIERKESLREKRKKEPKLKRHTPFLDVNPTIVIVCEGKNTETSYFKQFKCKTATIEVLGLGCNTISVVDRAIEIEKKKNYDQIWCVFDADPNPINPKQLENFNKAVFDIKQKQAKNPKWNIAYSNQAFEYWLILHLLDHQGGPMPRRDYYFKINELLKSAGQNIKCNIDKKISIEFFEYLNGYDPLYKKRRVDLAIERAKRIYNNFSHINPGKEESSTTVFLLVEELLKYSDI